MATLIKSRGYTLIELVVVAGLVGMLSVGMISVFLASLRGSSKAQLEAEVRSKGDYAITLMERNLRLASSAPDCPSAYIVNYSVQTTSGLVDRSYVYASNQITDGTNSLFGDGSGMIVSPVGGVVFTCDSPAGGYGSGSVTISFSLMANGKMNQTVTQVFKTTVAIRSIQ